MGDEIRKLSCPSDALVGAVVDDVVDTGAEDGWGGVIAMGGV